MARTAQRVVEVGDGTGCSGRSAALFACAPSGTLLAVGAGQAGRPGEPVSALVHPSSVARLDAILREVREGASGGTACLRLACCPAVELSVSWSVLTGACPDSDQVVFVAAAAAEPSSRPGFRPSLRLQEAGDRLAREVTVVADAHGALLHASPSAAPVLGYGADGVLPADVWGVVHPDDAPSVRAGLRAVVDDGEPRAATLRVRAADGDWRWVELVAVSLRDDALGAVACALHDITAEVEAKQALRASEARFRAFADASVDGVCMVGLDGETQYANRRLAAILGVPMTPGYYVELMSTLELGGPGGTPGSGRMETAYAHPDGHERRLRVAATPLLAADGGAAGTLIVISDGTSVRREAHDRHPGDVALAADLRAAIDGDALHLEFQPVVDLRSGVVVGMEALARWTHPGRGEVPPTTFVAVAERTGLAPQLDRWAVRRALQDMAGLRAAGVVPEEAYLAVNLSACSVAATFAVEDLLSWTEQAGLPPRQLVLEITETAIMQDRDAAIRLLSRLRQHGVRVAMDDFGTGYSSLAYLRDLPISALKIDRSFVADLTGHPEARAIVASVVALARAVGVAVVAEGVETAIQAAVLQRLGCMHAQGWLWSRSVPVAKLLEGDRWSTLLPSAGEPNPARVGVERDAGVAQGVRRIVELHQDGASVATIVATLEAEGFRTPAGRRWHRSSVARVIAERIRRYAGPADASGRATRHGPRP